MKESWQNVGDILINPTAAFTRLKDKPTWGVALMVYCLLSFILAWTLLPYTHASVEADGDVWLWDINKERIIRNFRGHTERVNSVVFSPNGNTLASGSDDHTIRLWEVDTGRLIRTFKGHTENVNSVSFSPNGRTLASGSLDQKLLVWDIKFKSNTDDDGWVLISPYSDENLADVTGYSNCATRFACVLTEKGN